MRVTKMTILHLKTQHDWRWFVLAPVLSLLCCPAVQGSDTASKSAAKEAATGVHFTVQADDKNGMLMVTQLMNSATGYNWVANATPVGPMVQQRGGDPWTGAIQSGAFKLAACEVRKGKNGIDGVQAQWRQQDGLELHWSAQKVSGVLEFQSEAKNTGAADVKDITMLGSLAIDLSVRPKDLQVHYLNRKEYRKAQFSGEGEICGGSWNNPQSAGWIAIENIKDQEIVFLGVEWESNWKVTLKPCQNGVRLSCSLETGGHTLARQASLNSPRIFLGVSHGDVDDSLRVLHDHLRKIMPPVPANFPWVTYDIWGTEATGVEKGVLDEIPVAASLGIELFYIDAGWCEGSCKNGSGDWFTGVGNWGKEDRVKYPGGLAEISKKVHAAGMKFGLWFAPQVCDSRLIGSTVPVECVAKCDGKDITLTVNDWAPITQICTGNPKTVEYLKKTLGDTVERYSLDWLKWDNSGLPGPVCNCADHGHQATDGALAALKGQYEIWNYLHKRFPKLILEQCGYPSRLDYGLARSVQAHWLADSTQPALHVRQNQLHASYVFPAAHNEAWVIRCGEIEAAKDPAVLDTLVRSRMIGLFGIGTLTGKLTERASLYPKEVLDALKRNIEVYKHFRHLLQEDVYHILPPSSSNDAWDAIQFCKRDGSESVLIVFRGNSPETEKILPLRGLKVDATYDAKSYNGGPTHTVSGKELAAGLKINLPRPEMSEIIHMKRCSLPVK